MTVRLLKPYAQRPANALATFDASIEAGLIGASQASADLTGGVKYFVPRPGLTLQSKQIAVGSVTLKMEEQTTILLPEGQVLLVTGAALTVGAISRSGSSDTWAVGAGALPQIGPYVGMQKFLMTCDSGGIFAKVQEASLTASGGAAAPTITGSFQVGQTITASLPAGVVGTLQFTRSLTTAPFTKTAISGAVANAVNSLTYQIQVGDGGYSIGCEASNQVTQTIGGTVPGSAATKPATPVAPVLTAVASAITVTYTAPADGGSAILEGQFADVNGVATALTGSPQNIAKTAGVPITGATRFRNALGWSDWSAQSNQVTPTAPVTASVVRKAFNSSAFNTTF